MGLVRVHKVLVVGSTQDSLHGFTHKVWPSGKNPTTSCDSQVPLAGETFWRPLPSNSSHPSFYSSP